MLVAMQEAASGDLGRVNKCIPINCSEYSNVPFGTVTAVQLSEILDTAIVIFFSHTNKRWQK